MWKPLEEMQALVGLAVAPIRRLFRERSYQAAKAGAIEGLGDFLAEATGLAPGLVADEIERRTGVRPELAAPASEAPPARTNGRTKVNRVAAIAGK